MENLEWNSVRNSPAFEPPRARSFGTSRSTGMWFRIDLTVPQDEVGTTAWLRVTPALIWQVHWHDDSGRSGKSGMSIPLSKQQHPASPTIIRVKLDRTQIRLFVHVLSAAPELTHMALLSDSALQDEVRRNTLIQAMFLGAVSLMLILTLLNWAFTRSEINKVFALYLATTTLFVQFVNGGINTYLLPEHPVWMARLCFAAFMWAIAATIAFSLVALDIRQNLPRLVRPLKLLALAVLMASVLGWNLALIAPISAIMWPFHLIFGMGLLGISIQQAIKWKTPQSLLVCAAYLFFNIFEKFPLMTMLGWFPAEAWTSDVAKVGLAIQMLLTQVQWSLRYREQQDLQRLAREAALEARAACAQREDLLRFLSMFGHEVKTPLAIIHAATESLEMLPGSENAANRSRHERIRSAVERLNILSREALSRERMEASAWLPRFCTVEMKVLIDDVLRWQQLTPLDHSTSNRTLSYSLPCSIGGREGGQLHVHLDGRIPDIQADPDMLHLALTNLLDNARKYGNAASEIHIDISCLHSPDPESSRCLIEVFSQGVEITEHDEQRIFDKYWRGAEHRNIPGAGIGLYLVKTVALAHRGKIQVKSLANHWSCFILELPVIQPLHTQ